MDAPANSSPSLKSAVRTRILTAIPLIAGFMVALFFASPQVWMGLMALITLVAGVEWATLAKLTRLNGLLYGSLVGLTGIPIALSFHGQPWIYYPALLFWLLAPVLLKHELPLRAPSLLLPLGALILISTFLAMVELRAESPDLLLVVVGVVVVADSAAYFSGRRFGRNKLAPSISPGKTREGAIGAWLAVTVYALLVHFNWPRSCGFQCLPQVLASFWTLFVLSVLGDLFESWLKRQAGVKDSGNILPGHGGVLDRIDSLTAVLPAAALFWMWLK